MNDVAFIPLLERSWKRATGGLLPLVVVPIATGLLAVDELEATLAHDGIHLGVEFAFPAMIVDVWTFVSTPNPDGVSVSPSLWLVPVVVLVHAILGAGYLGSIRDGLEAESIDFLANVSRYGVRILGYVLAVYALLVPVALLALVDPGVAVVAVLLGIPVGSVLWYLFFATPYLVVLLDVSLLDAAARSYALAIQGGAYFEYAIKYFGFVLVSSVVVSLVAVNLPLVGIFLALVGTAPLALTLNVATMAILRDVLRGPGPSATV